MKTNEKVEIFKSLPIGAPILVTGYFTNVFDLFFFQEYVHVNVPYIHTVRLYREPKYPDRKTYEIFDINQCTPIQLIKF